MPTALVLGGTGMLRTSVEALARAGHRTTVTCRSLQGVPAHWERCGIRVETVDREDAAAVAELASHSDVVLDGLCHGPVEARQLATWSRHAAVVMVSSAAVYLDPRGNHQNSEVRARWPGPIGEDTPTMAYRGEPWDSRLGYGAAKAEAERILLADATTPLVLRPAKIHGPGMRNPREWQVVGPLLAGRTLRVRDVATRESSTSAADLAGVVLAHLSEVTTRVVNVADGDAPTPLERARAIASLLPGTPVVEAIDPDAPGDDGWLPWPADRILDTARQRALGVEPVAHAQAVRPAVEWLVAQHPRD